MFCEKTLEFLIIGGASCRALLDSGFSVLCSCVVRTWLVGKSLEVAEVCGTKRMTMTHMLWHSNHSAAMTGIHTQRPWYILRVLQRRVDAVHIMGVRQLPLIVRYQLLWCILKGLRV